MSLKVKPRDVANAEQQFVGKKQAAAKTVALVLVKMRVSSGLRASSDEAPVDHPVFCLVGMRQ